MSSRPGGDDARAGGARRPRESAEQELQRRREQKRRRHDAQQLQQLKHLESFYEKPPPGLIKEDETKPEDCIPDVPGNEHAREFLAHAPTKGLWMPLGKEVKVMQCWRCKRYGHRTGDKECPFFIKGNQKLEQFRVAHEDPMYDIIRENKRHEKDIRHCGPRPEGVESGKTWRPQESRAFGVTRVNSHLPSSEDVTPGGLSTLQSYLENEEKSPELLLPRAVIGWKKWIPTH
ncbi:retinitis pigmentosa 9 protein-like isoform X3 [Panthera tigris]|uniref:retinitis pigmentosa 9 protein-like isoform X3 n=1 Tax=Panthera tigris TaxID=9694 RepID=UPI001C6FA586|nr:retinitis pigmentosa 9 protein-like isoform X3 [Panthera tigris]